MDERMERAPKCPPVSVRVLLALTVFALVAVACSSSDAPAAEEQLIEPASDTAAPSASQPSTLDPSTLPSTWQPWEWGGWQKFPSLYFAAEAEGFMEQEQIDKVNQFSLAILEFRSGQFVAEETSGEWADGDLAGFMEQQAAQIRSSDPDGPPILTYRSGMWAGAMYAAQWEALQNQDLFIDESNFCEGFIEYPKDIGETGFETDLEYCRWDFSNPDAQETYRSLIHDAALQDSDGVFFDNTQSVVCDDSGDLSSLTFDQRRELSAATNQVYRDVFADLVANDKYPVLSTTNSFSDIGPPVPWENDCPDGEEVTNAALEGIPFARNNEFWMWNLGDLGRDQIRNSIRETESGIPIIVHMPWFPNDGGCESGCVRADGSTKTFSTQSEFLEFGIAAFLVSMGPGSYFGFSDMQNDPEGGGWFDVSWEYYPQYDEIVTGEPIGPVEVSDSGMTFTRTFKNGVVWVNVADGTYSIDLAGATYSSP